MFLGRDSHDKSPVALRITAGTRSEAKRSETCAVRLRRAQSQVADTSRFDAHGTASFASQGDAPGAPRSATLQKCLDRAKQPRRETGRQD